MNVAMKLISLAALGATIVPSLFYFGGVLGHDPVKVIVLVGSIAWFVATPMWMGRELSVDAKEIEI